MSYLEQQLDIKKGEPHYKAAMYVKEHALSLLDFDCWAHLEDLLGFEISYEEYCKADGAIDGDMLEVRRGDYEHRIILEALNEDNVKKSAIMYNVAIKDLEDDECDIWISSFSTREKAEAFMKEAKRKLCDLNICTVQVCLDSAYVDDDMYLGWIDDRYGDNLDDT